MSVHLHAPNGWDEIQEIAKGTEYKPYAYFKEISCERLDSYLARFLARRCVANETTVIMARTGSVSAGVAVLEHLPWDTQHFGRRCGRIEVFAAEGGYSLQWEVADCLLQGLLDCAKEQRYGFLWAKCNAGFSALIHALEGNGFRLMDCELTLIHSATLPADTGGGYYSRVTRKEPVPGLEQLGTIFRYSRFHSDPKISRDQADGLWQKSILDQCEGFADEVVILYDNAEPIAFVSCKDDELSSEVFPEKVRSFFLVGVSPKHQGRGAGRTLMHAALERSLAQTTLIQVETQSRNEGGLALYQKSGFRIAASRFSFHCWL